MSLHFDTERLHLRELRATDWKGARTLDTDPRVVRYMSYDVLDEAGTRAYLERALAAQRAVPRHTYELAVTLAEDPDTFVGRVGLAVRRPEHREAELWFQLRADLWGRGLMTEAVRPLVAYGFRELHLHRIYGDCDPRNAGSAAVMRKLGMRYEGHLRQNWFLKGEWCDSHLYALLEDEWAQA